MFLKYPLLIISFLWQLPQNLLGFMLYQKLKRRNQVKQVEFQKNRWFIHAEEAVSLGWFVFWNIDYHDQIFDLTIVNKEHEYGHSLQSAIFGPFYLLVIGLPSFCRVQYAYYYYRKNGQKWKGYYHGYPEKWADQLGKVDSTQGIYLTPN